MGDPFAVDVTRAVDALSFCWGDQYDEIWAHDGQWGAHHKDAGDEDVTGDTPDALNRALRADYLRRCAQ